MKLNIIAAVLLCATVATASETTSTQATATPAAQPAKAASTKKVAKKAKKAKPATSEQAPAAQAQPAQVAPQAAAAPAGTSTATAAPAAPAKKWGVSIYQENSMDYANGKKNAGDMAISTANYVGASYKITANEKVSVKQHYLYDYDPSSEKEFETHDINQSFTQAGISTKTKGILGSDDIAPALSWYLPGHTAEETNFGKDLSGFNGILRGDAEIAWTLSPKWSVSYYVSPRQTMGKTQTYMNANTGKEATFFATSRYIQLANLYYNVSDETQIYLNVGMDSRMRTSTLTSTSDDYLSALGASVGFFGGKVTLNPEISVTSNMKSKGVAARSQRLYQKENTTYMLATVIAL